MIADEYTPLEGSKIQRIVLLLKEMDGEELTAAGISERLPGIDPAIVNGLLAPAVARGVVAMRKISEHRRSPWRYRWRNEAAEHRRPGRNGAPVPSVFALGGVPDTPRPAVDVRLEDGEPKARDIPTIASIGQPAGAFTAGTVSPDAHANAAAIARAEADVGTVGVGAPADVMPWAAEQAQPACYKPRFAIWSDGQLEVRSAAGQVVLQRSEFIALLAFLRSVDCDEATA